LYFRNFRKTFIGLTPLSTIFGGKRGEIFFIQFWSGLVKRGKGIAYLSDSLTYFMNSFTARIFDENILLCFSFSLPVFITFVIRLLPKNGVIITKKK
jgi:hypothetical protein